MVVQDTGLGLSLITVTITRMLLRLRKRAKEDLNIPRTQYMELKSFRVANPIKEVSIASDAGISLSRRETTRVRGECRSHSLDFELIRLQDMIRRVEIDSELNSPVLDCFKKKNRIPFRLDREESSEQRRSNLTPELLTKNGQLLPKNGTGDSRHCHRRLCQHASTVTPSVNAPAAATTPRHPAYKTARNDVSLHLALAAEPEARAAGVWLARLEHPLGILTQKWPTFTKKWHR